MTADTDVTAAHILELLDSVEAQLAVIRAWADRLIIRDDKEGDADEPVVGT
jgi:hypothetical protein